MWWAIGIFGGVCFVAFLWFLLVSGAKAVAEEAHKKSILEAIAKEYLVRRQNGETLDQIADSLYKQYPISRPIEFSSGYYYPIPLGKLNFASLMKPIPEEGKQLGKIAYTLLCNRGVYSMPQQGQDRRDSACEYDALRSIQKECLAQMVILEAAGGKINQDLRAMLNKWAEVGDDIALTIYFINSFRGYHNGSTFLLLQNGEKVPITLTKQPDEPIDGERDYTLDFEISSNTSLMGTWKIKSVFLEVVSVDPIEPIKCYIPNAGLGEARQFTGRFAAQRGKYECNFGDTGKSVFLRSGEQETVKIAVNSKDEGKYTLRLLLELSTVDRIMTSSVGEFSDVRILEHSRIDSLPRMP